MRPLWIAYCTVQKMSGADILPYDEFILSVLTGDMSEKVSPKLPKRTAENIEADFLSIVEADKLGMRKEI